MITIPTQETSALRYAVQFRQSPLGVGAVKPMSVTTLEVELSPVDAAEIIMRVHPKQRKPNLGRVRNLLLAMQSGKWHEPPFTADSIAFDSDGFLVNGMHRMLALAQHNKPLRFLILLGVRAPADMPLVECDGVLPRSASFIEGVNRDDWAVVSFLVTEMLLDHNPPRQRVRSAYDRLHDAIAAIPDYHIKSSQPAAVRAAFVVQWFAADSIMRATLEEQWKYLNTLHFEFTQPGIMALYRALDKTRGNAGGQIRSLQFAQAMTAIERIDDAVRLYPNTKIARGFIKKHLGDL